MLIIVFVRIIIYVMGEKLFISCRGHDDAEAGYCKSLILSSWCVVRPPGDACGTNWFQYPFICSIYLYVKELDGFAIRSCRVIISLHEQLILLYRFAVTNLGTRKTGCFRKYWTLRSRARSDVLPIFARKGSA